MTIEQGQLLHCGLRLLALNGKEIQRGNEAGAIRPGLTMDQQRLRRLPQDRQDGVRVPGSSSRMADMRTS